MKLLMIEDNPYDAELVTAELRRFGLDFEPRRVDTRAALAEALDEGPWSLILCDYNLPGFGGGEALAMVRAVDARVPFIIVSGMVGEERAVDIIRAGANDYVMKDRLGRLGPAIERELRDQQLRAERSSLFDAFRRSEERYRRIFEHAPIGVAVSTPDGRFLKINDRVVTTLGYPREAIVGRHLADFALDRRPGDATTYEARFLRRDGAIVWGSVTVSAIASDNGDIEQIVWLIEDITARKQTQEQLSMQARLLDSVQEAVVAADKTGRIIYWNRFAEELYGWRAERVMGRLLLEMIPPQTREDGTNILRRLIAGGHWSGELTLQRRNGTLFPAWVLGGALHDAAGNLAGVVAVSHDITERRRAEEELRSSRELLADAQRIARMGSWELDLETGRRAWSDEFYRIFGFEPRKQPDVALIESRYHPDDLPAVQARRFEMAEKGGPFDDTARLLMPDGEVRWVQGRGRVINNDAGKPVKVIGVLQDVTELRMHQEELQRRAMQHAAVADLGAIGLRGDSIDALLAEAAETATRVLGVEFSSIIEKTAGGFRYAAGHGWDGELTPGEMLDNTAYSSFVISQDAPVVVDDLQTETRFEIPPRFVRTGVVSGLGIPIVTGKQETWGLLNAYSRTRRVFSTADVDFLRSIAAVLAQAIERQSVESELRVRALQQSAIAELSRLAVKSVGTATLDRACTLIQERLGVEHAMYYELDVESGVLRYRAGTHWAAEPYPVVPVDERSQSGVSLLNNHPVVVDDYTAAHFGTAPLFIEAGIRSGVTVPVSSPTSIFGVLVAQSRHDKRFSESDVHFIESLANLMSEAMERERASRALVASEERYRDVVEGASEVIFTISMQGTFTSINAAFEKVTGFPASEWIGRRYIELVHPDHRGHSGGVFRKVVEDHESVSDVLPILGKNGPVTVELTSFPKVENGRTTAIYGFARDVTDTLRAEKERQNLTRNLQLLLESTVEGIITTDLDGICTMCNAAAARLVGRSQDELLGADMHGLLYEKPGVRSAESPMFAVGRTGEICELALDVFWRPDGTAVPVEYSAAPIVDEGVPVGIVVSFTDISERQKLEAKLEQANRVSSLGRLAATVAHEFNNVLMGIAPFVELVRRGKNVEVSLEHIARAVKRGRRITEDILRFSQPAEPARTTFEVDGWLQNICVEARTLLPPSCSIEVAITEPGLRIDGDPNQLQQMFTNLILNARDAMVGSGAINIAACREQPGARLPFAVDQPERFVHFIVSDNGSGMPPETLRHIFEPLFTTKKSGTGLGLSVTHQVVQRHGGDIFAESTVGIGTTFHIFIPMAERPALELVDDQNDAAPTATGARRVLLVEDDRAVSTGLAALLECEGMIVDLAESGAAAIAALARRTPDVVVLDVGLPDMDGVAVYDRIAVTHPTLPVIFSTGHGDRSKLDELLNKPHLAYLLKPYEVSTLLETIGSVMHQTMQRQTA
ncbi:MAG: PAS domain S-box protein [Acidobacteria bacterium]|nr:PAS domain S-box protein [Acidobacteriota bacterium]MBV9478000.1 PAS domain S-box protein [Acidobacteriota bacterium]